MKKDTKPYDTAFKDLAEREPELLLRLIGALPPGATVKPLAREISAPMLAADQPYEVTSPAEHFIAHVEAQTRWELDVPARVVKYKALFWINCGLLVQSYVLVLTPSGLPADVPTSHTIEMPGLTLTGDFTVIKVWELSAAEALATGSPSVLPFIPLMAGGQTELEQAARALGAVADEVWRQRLAVHFVVNGGLRYTKPYLYDLLGRLAMIPIQALRESSVYQFILAEGERKMLAEMLQRIAQNRFPGIQLGEEVAHVHDL
jgi:predicted transposase YdaD